MFVRLILLLAAIGVLTGGMCVAQVETPRPTQSSAVPVVSFEASWKAADPEWYLVSIDSERKVTYRSRPHVQEVQPAGDPFSMEFTATEPTTTRIFELAKTANYFKGDFETKAKNIAQTGEKTLRYVDAKVQTSTTYNQPTDPSVAEVTAIFQHISQSMEMGRRLSFNLRFDKLGVDEILKQMEQMKKNGMMIEVQALEPMLMTIVKDKSFMNVSRQRAQRLLGLPVSPSGSR